jgi:hypothetical protein
MWGCRWECRWEWYNVCMVERGCHLDMALTCNDGLGKGNALADAVRAGRQEDLRKLGICCQQGACDRGGMGGRPVCMRRQGQLGWVACTAKRGGNWGWLQKRVSVNRCHAVLSKFQNPAVGGLGAWSPGHACNAERGSARHSPASLAMPSPLALKGEFLTELIVGQQLSRMGRGGNRVLGMRG